MDTSMYTQVHEGMDVLDQNGDKIGKAGETLPDRHCFNLDTGFLGIGKEYYVPFSAVQEVQADAVYLNVLKDDLDTFGWDQPPAPTTTTTTTTGEWQAERTGMPAGARMDTAEDQTLHLREEQLQARKTPVETGHVSLGKEVVEEEKTLEVPVSREEAYIERRPVERQPADSPISESESQTIRVPLHEERVEVEKQPVVYEEVGVGKRRTQETRQVSDTVRREELRTDKEGDIDVRSDPNP